MGAPTFAKEHEYGVHVGAPLPLPKNPNAARDDRQKKNSKERELNKCPICFVLVCWCVGMLVCWCVGVLVCWCVGVLVC